MNFLRSREQLATACQDELRRYGVPVQWLDVHVNGDAAWSVTLLTGSRTFHFGIIEGQRYGFEERTTPQPVDFVAHARPPASATPEILWRYSFELLRRALAEARFRGADSVTI
jgi:hypothetical protein